MKQTAVEWLAKELLREHPILTNHDAIQQAKEMEKQQQDDFAIEFAEWLLINAYMNGTISYKTCMLKSQGVDIKTKELLEMFKKEKGL